jgi:proteic killer suppression protein
MRVTFSSNQLQTLCESEKKLRIKYGKPGERVIRERLDDLAAATNALMLRYVAGHFEELTADLKGSMSLRAHGGFRIVFSPSQSPPPFKPDGGLDLAAITEIVIDSIVDYHRHGR